jgi:hypothetical protein
VYAQASYWIWPSVARIEMPYFYPPREQLWNLHPSSEWNHWADESLGWYLVLISRLPWNGGQRLWVVICDLTTNRSVEILTRDGYDGYGIVKEWCTMRCYCSIYIEDISINLKLVETLKLSFKSPCLWALVWPWNPQFIPNSSVAWKVSTNWELCNESG